MKTLHKLFTAVLLLFIFTNAAFAQTDAQALIKQGIQLHDQGKFAEAIDKYQQAIKADPANMQAEFELSYSLFSSGKGTDAIPHLEKVIKNEKSLSAGAYDLLGSIYDDNKQADKAIELYKQGIKANPQYQRLYYNLGLSLLRQQKYADAETQAIEALKLDPKHGSSHRLYAVACLGQNKGVCAIMAFCNFLMLEPQTQRSTEAYQQIQQIIQSKVKVTDDKKINMFIQDQKGGDQDMGAAEMGLSLAAASANLEQNKGKSLPALFEDQLKTILGITGELSAKKKDKGFFWKFYADYFYKLSQSANMPVFARIVSLTGNQQENIQWFKDHPDDLKTLDAWFKSTERSF
ncbi:MAG: tetratricopeptide repeat protein [Bacteroidota bacterium]